MPDAMWWFVAGLATLPAAAGIWATFNWTTRRFRDWYTRPIDLTGRPLAFRRSLITGVVIELLDSTHVRAIRLPFHRMLVIRSNPDREYDFVGQPYVLIGVDFENVRSLLGKAFDELGYGEEPRDA